jgi:magnesium and cobalt exporter, CNNM family
MEVELALSFLLLLALTFLATVDMAFGQLSDVGLRRLATEAEEHPTARYTPFLKEILRNRARFSFTLSAAIQILLIVFSVLVTYISLQWFSANSLALFSSLFSGLLLAGIFRQFIPRLLSLRNPEGKLPRLLPLLRPFYRLLAFAAEPWHRSFDRLREQEELEEADSEEEEDDAGDDIQAFIDVGEAEGIIEEEERELIHSVFEFGDKTVEEVMTPRTEIIAVPNTASVREACDLMIETKHSRLPVFREQIDNIDGLIYVRDLLICWTADKAESPITPLIRPVYFIPETKPVARLLEEMQKAHAYLAIVIDEYGGIAGLVTVEDILEEIVGEIEDEDKSGEEPEAIVAAGDGVYEVMGGTEIGKIERLFDMEIEADDFTTIAGLVINEQGKVPDVGERFTLRGLEVEVLDADERRINRLRVKAEPEVATDETDENQKQIPAGKKN